MPPNAVPGNTFARFRYGYENNLPPTGPSPRGGEVEDYVVSVLSDQPIANDDVFDEVDQNTADNPLDVLANDVPSSSGSQNLVLDSVDFAGASGSGFIDDNGTPADFTDDFVSYTTAPGAYGQDSFSYTIKDNVTLDTDTATVVVTVQQTAGTIPIAVDDSFEVATTKRLDEEMLANDRTGPDGPISILSIDATGTSGTVTLIDDEVEYTPAAGFEGSDQFQYTIIDSNSVTSTATVTIHVPTHTLDDVISFRLETRDMNGGQISEIGQGLPFQLFVYVDDERGESGHPSLDPGLTLVDQGVFSAYMDLLYDAGLVAYSGDSLITHSVEYPVGHNVNSSVPGILDEFGAFQPPDSIPLGPNEQLFASIVYTASAQGTATFRTDPADDLPLHETSHNFPELQRTYQEIEFGKTSIEIVESPDWVEIRLEATDLNGVPLTSPIVAGSDFLLRAFTEDRRRVDDPTFPILDMGVFSAYLDVFYDDTLAAPVAVSPAVNPFGIDITFGSLFVSGQKVGTDASGILDEVGAFQGDTADLFFGEELLFQIRFTALPPQSGIDNLVFLADPADDQPLNEVSLIKPDPGISVPTAQVLYLDSQVITVVTAAGEGEYTNPGNPVDVNNDGEGSPIDALILINFLNNQGSMALAGGEGESSGTRYYYDVNGDMVVSPLDVLGVISYLNGANVQSGGEGEGSAELVETVPAATVEPIDVPLISELTTLGPAETTYPSDDEANRTASRTAVEEDEAETKVRGVSPLEELADETMGLADVITDDLAEDILGAWTGLPSDQELIAELI